MKYIIYELRKWNENEEMMVAVNAIYTMAITATIISSFSYIHEKITQFWLAEKEVQFLCNTSAKLVTRVQITNGFWLAENKKETTKNQSD